MKTRTIVASLAVAGATLGMVGTALAQSSDPTTPPDAAAKGTRKEFVCSHQDQINDILSQRKALVNSRLALLKEAREAAAGAGASKLVVRVDNRMAKAARDQERVETRTQKFATWVGQNCTG
jgi:hypothetical protein